MPKRNKAAMNQAMRNQTETTTTEFASETNVAEVRRQNQQSAANAAQRAQQPQQPTE
ncbi:gamma-type small acid-soluble spore protein [Brevibacillus composti]|uniref:Small, acid-soluble spore protein gamma-type n=1 Tax=Brevibacillus composti TaxID=2796470 RepID=A0A7T5ELS6_9BACL|nr:gamma-type small acid-soluble spore protein [Brevibacillus composti]QQE74871.1 gamma-type small acid-soluble spore protein [Brevibacillus composti]QUO41955.1 gamma-type small acid-soluble spore protein [Brevibacillus composti]